MELGCLYDNAGSFLGLLNVSTLEFVMLAGFEWRGRGFSSRGRHSD